MAKFKSKYEDIKDNLTTVMGGRLKPIDETRWTDINGNSLTIIGHSHGNYKAEVRWDSGDTEYINWDRWDRCGDFAIA